MEAMTTQSPSRIRNLDAAIFILVLLSGIPTALSFALLSFSSQSVSKGLPSASTSTTMAASASPSDNVNTNAGATTNHSLGPRVLRKLVQDASLQNMQTHSLDLGGIVWLEHINLIVGDMATATKFYVDFLGMTSERESNPKSNHFNLGQQQFHLAAIQKDGDDWPQRVTGSIGLCVPSLVRIRERFDRAQSELRGTLFSIMEEDTNIMTVTCPWGNMIHLYDISIDDKYDGPSSVSSPSSLKKGAVPTSQQKMVLFHEEGGVYGPHRMAVRTNPGIRYVEIACEVGTIHSIADFYETLLGCQVTRRPITNNDTGSSNAYEVQSAIVSVGPGVHIVFVEQATLSRECIKQMNGVHICFYISHFQRSYNELTKRNLIWTNPRFQHLDSCDTWEECASSRTFRFKNIVDIKTGEKLLELEHETRPMLHGQYMKVPPYMPK
jgi:catechol-2,3-dioxygenase